MTLVIVDKSVDIKLHTNCLPSLYQLDTTQSHLKRESQLRDCLGQVGLWAWLWEGFLMLADVGVASSLCQGRAFLGQPRLTCPGKSWA